MTIADVAALAGVSVAAVSKVVNNRTGISEATARRVRDAAAQLRWAPSSAAVALRGARSRTVGLVAARDPDLLLADPHFTVLVSGIEAELAPRGYGLLLHLVSESGERPEAAEDEEQVYRRLGQQRRVDGVLLTESRVEDPRPRLLRELGVPAVMIGRPWGDDPVVQVSGRDEFAGVREAAVHLLRLGHRRIAYVHGPQDRVHTRLRLAAFAEALAAAGGGSPTVVGTSGFGGDSGARAATELLSQPPGRRPTALVLANDSMAVAAMSAAARLGLRVPDDVSVVGHDDLPLAQWVHPRLTTVSQDLAGLGRAGARRLLHLLGEPDPDLPQVQGTRLVVRESSGPASA
ncbi:MAG: LacI family DNA-binding transcriptional regulator [Kineosporiaceae bacterium]